MNGSRKDAVADSLGSLRAAGLVPRPDVRTAAVGWAARQVSDTRLQAIERALVAGEPLSALVATHPHPPSDGAHPGPPSDAAGPERPEPGRPDGDPPQSGSPSARRAGTGATPNVAGLEDPAALLLLEADLVHLRQVQLAARPVEGLFDLRHLQRLHLRLYGALYWSAGDLRTTEIVRMGRPACPPEELGTRGQVVFADVERGPVLRAMGRARVVDRLAVHLAAVDALHPFVVGNACAARAFAGTWAAQAGLRVAWAELDPAESLFASDAASRGALDPARRLLDRLVRPLREPPAARSPGF